VFDRLVIDGAVNWAGKLTALLGEAGRKVQTGFVRSYAVGILGGAVLIGGLLFVKAR